MNAATAAAFIPECHPFAAGGWYTDNDNIWLIWLNFKKQSLIAHQPECFCRAMPFASAD